MQTVIYDVDLARTSNCDIGTSHSVRRWAKQYGTEHLSNSFIAWCNCIDNRE